MAHARVKKNMINPVTYSENGNLYKEHVYEADNKLSYTEVKKFDNKLLKEEISYNSNNRIKSKSIYTYSSGQVQERRFYLYSKRKNGLFLSSVDFYDKQGDSKIFISFNSTEEITDITTVYKNGLLTKLFYQDKESSYISAVQKFNKNGKLIKTIYYNAKGKAKAHEIYKYDKYGNNIEYVSYNLLDKGMYKLINIYDKYGNSIKQIEFENNVPKYIITHEYEYY